MPSSYHDSHCTYGYILEFSPTRGMRRFISQLMWTCATVGYMLPRYRRSFGSLMRSPSSVCAEGENFTSPALLAFSHYWEVYFYLYFYILKNKPREIYIQKGVTEDEMIGWHHWFNGHEFEQTLGDSEGQGSLTHCSPWGHKESDRT